MSATVITYAEPMSRWEPNAPERLRQAAMDLFTEVGFEDTTVARIAERAGLTERTFFRHYSDKREVLFAGSTELEDALVGAAAAAPASASPMEAVALSLQQAGAWFRDRGEFARARQKVVSAHPALTERELIKMARLAAALAEALRGRG